MTLQSCFVRCRSRPRERASDSGLQIDSESLRPLKKMRASGSLAFGADKLSDKSADGVA